MLPVITEIIKQDIAESSADYDAQHCPDHIILNCFRRVFVLFVFDPVKNHNINEGKSDNIHQAVITQLK